MRITTGYRGLLLLAALLPVGIPAAPVPIDTSSALNGVTEIYSVTFDGPVVPCGPSSPSFCTFFNGYPPPSPPAVRQLQIVPNPGGVIDGVPAGLTPAPAPGAYLDLTLGNGNTTVTLAGGTIEFPNITIVIRNDTVVNTAAAGIVFNPAPQTTTVDANGVAVFEVDLAPTIAVDFSNFIDVVTACAGTYCDLIPVLTLDMVRYRLAVDYDPSFTNFTASFVGQTANNSFLYVTLNSVSARVEVSDSVPPTDDQQIPFGSVTEQNSATEQVTVTNSGGGTLTLGMLAQANPLAAPFSITNDNCSGQSLQPSTSCTADVNFAPTAIGDYADSFDIPSSDAAQPSVTVTVSGKGSSPVPNIVVTDAVAPFRDLELPFGLVSTGQTVSQNVGVSNNGTVDLVLGPIGVANPLLAPFAIANDGCSGQTLAPFAGCSFQVTFSPALVASFADDVDIPSNDPDTPATTLAVSGDGTSLQLPDIKVTDPFNPPNDLQMGFQNVLVSTTAELQITIGNDGAADLLIGAIGSTDGLAAPFSIAADDCSGQTVPPAGSCTVTVAFAPTAIDLFTDSFDIPSNDPTAPDLTFRVSGNGGGNNTQTVSASGASSGFMAVDPLTLIAAGLAGAAIRRRGARRRQASARSAVQRSGEMSSGSR